MKKQLFTLSIFGLLIGTVQATNPAFLKVKKAVTKTVLNPQASHSSSSRAAASRLLAESNYSGGDFNDSTKYFYNNNFASFQENDALVENLLGSIWKFDSSIYVYDTVLARTVKRTYTGSQLTTEISTDLASNQRERYTMSYNAQDKVSQVLLEDATGVNFTTSARYKITYNPAGLIDSLIGSFPIAGVFIDQYIVKYTYNTAQKVTKVISYAFNAPNWEVEDDTRYTYDASNRVVLTKSWYDQGSGLELNDSTITAYVGATIQHDTMYSFFNGSLDGGQAQKTIKTAFDKPQMEITNGNFDVMSSMWSASADTTFILYNSFQQITKSTSGISPFTDVNNYFYETYTVAGIADVTSSEIKSLYPNPASNTLKLELANPTIGNITINVYDLSGRLVQATESNTKDSLNIDVSALSIGNYVLKIVGEKNSFVGQFAKTN